MKKFLYLLPLYILHVPSVAFAAVDPLQSLTKVGDKIYGTGVNLDLKITIARIIQILIGFVGVIFLILILLGGFRWMTSAGNEKKIEDAKRLITNATIGLVIILMAYAIAFTITKWLSTATKSTTGGTSGTS